jgi:hypothetical protein
MVRVLCFVAVSAICRQRGWRQWEKRARLNYSTSRDDAAQDSLLYNATESNSSGRLCAQPVRESASTNWVANPCISRVRGVSVDSGSTSLRLPEPGGLASERRGGNWSSDASWRAFHFCGAGVQNPENVESDPGDPSQACELVRGESDRMGPRDTGRQQAAMRESCVCLDSCVFPVLAVGRADE